MAKQRAYLDTNIISSLYYNESNVYALARRLQTRDWWRLERDNYDLLASVQVELELKDGLYPGQEQSLKAVRRLSYVRYSKGITQIVEGLIANRIVPDTETGDAFHLAFAITGEVHWLISWNYHHLVNPMTQTQLNKFCKSRKIFEPQIVSPESIPWRTMGDEPRWRSV